MSVIINLSHIILKQIIEYLSDNIDRICFSLTCKRFFHEREKYLTFCVDQSSKLFLLLGRKLRFYMKSYSAQLDHSLNSKSPCYLHIGSTSRKTTDYYIHERRLKNYEIPETVQTIEIEDSMKECYLKELSLLLEKSNLTLDGRCKPMFTPDTQNDFDELVIRGIQLYETIEYLKVKKLNLKSYSGIRELVCPDRVLLRGVESIELHIFNFSSTIELKTDVQPPILFKHLMAANFYNSCNISLLLRRSTLFSEYTVVSSDEKYYNYQIREISTGYYCLFGTSSNQIVSLVSVKFSIYTQIC
ncbi:hypothetical protein PPL_01530 [Heterostelium album PN500]|uniref:F-box domain-containing protein n=1 Tax=Heterostelium pallidum (strain ATCC 26659 / Pp 5 / PN500) TaxID=670386 RepID=D3AZR7_HETP5|nr:hypothetical protein PPL_01530 [Heterostelium album PN500]EFA84541.1 hypothetical protein PPL_01530 [Heterostelium album PN500]|eukprot:XP_020436654.1 hypothetical protein PPL_01530 [Heterostelium album PN500]